MFDYAYPSLKAFCRECALLGADPSALLANGSFVYCADGWIIAREIAYAVA